MPAEYWNAVSWERWREPQRTTDLEGAAVPTVVRDGAAVWWEADGHGPPLLMIQGLGYPADMWWRLLPALTPRFRTIRFDNRGAGRTGICPPGPHTMEALAADAAAVLDAAGEFSAHVLGVSMGGVVAQEFALACPKRTRSLVLGCTHPGPPDSVQPSVDALAMLGQRSRMTLAEAIEASIPFIYAPDTPRERIDEDVAVRLTNPTDPVGYELQLRGIVAHGGTGSRLPRLSVPTLVLHGSVDRLVPPGNAAVLGRLIPGSRVEMLDGASHLFFTDRPEHTQELLLGFYDRGLIC